MPWVLFCQIALLMILLYLIIHALIGEFFNKRSFNQLFLKVSEHENYRNVRPKQEP